MSDTGKSSLNDLTGEEAKSSSPFSSSSASSSSEKSNVYFGFDAERQEESLCQTMLLLWILMPCTVITCVAERLHQTAPQTLEADRGLSV